MTALRLGLWAAAAGGAVVVIAPLAHRFGLAPLGLAFAALALGFLTLLVGIVLLAIGGLRGRIPPGAELRTWGTLAAAVVVWLVPLWAIVSGGGAPPIHDITTDLDDPPAFVAAVALNEPGRTDYEGEAIAAQQRAAYPDIGPLTLQVDAATAFDRSLAAVEALGWELLASDADALRIEASDRTFWFGFTDDVVIRITESGMGVSRVDVRSLSRVGVGDLGANARRVRALLARLEES